MNPRSDCIWCQSAGLPDLVIAKAHDFAHQKDVAIEVGQRGERFVDRKVDVLGREPRPFFRQRRWLGAPQPCAVVIEREVSGDVKQPGPHLFFRRDRDGRAAHPEEDVLREIARGLRSDRPAEVPEKAVLVGCEEGGGVDGHA